MLTFVAFTPNFTLEKAAAASSCQLIDEPDLQSFVLFVYPHLACRLHRKDRTGRVSNNPLRNACAEQTPQTPTAACHYDQIALLLSRRGNDFFSDLARSYQRPDLCQLTESAPIFCSRKSSRFLSWSRRGFRCRLMPDDTAVSHGEKPGLLRNHRRSGP